MRMWIDPASIEWDWTFHRPLLHETLHFWQLLCSPYLARMIAAERAQLEIFEATNTVRQSTIYREQFTRVDEEVGFSAEHLLESWARFWEIQVQTPARLLEQENFKRHKLLDAMWKISDPNGPFFKKWYWSSLEVAMTQGSNCQLYGRPFRWMHSQVCAAARITPNALDEFNPRGFMPAYLVCSAYPSLLYASFRTDDPVSHFKTAVQRICDDAFLIGRFCSDLHAHFYELEWYNHWESFNEVVGTTSPLPMASGQLWSPFVASEKEFLDVGAKIFEMLDPDTLAIHPSTQRTSSSSNTALPSRSPTWAIARLDCSWRRYRRRRSCFSVERMGWFNIHIARARRTRKGSTNAQSRHITSRSVSTGSSARARRRNSGCLSTPSKVPDQVRVSSANGRFQDRAKTS